MRELFRSLFTLDDRSLALARICTGLIIIGDLISRSFEFTLHYTGSGILPLRYVFAMEASYFPNPYLLSEEPSFVIALFGLQGFFALMLLLGYRTRLATFFCWFMVHSLMQRNYLVNNGGDAVLVCFLAWSLFVPWGRRWSLDSLATQEKPEEHGVYSVGTVCLICQMLLIYWSSVYHKCEPSWLRGEAIYYAFNSELYSRPLSKLLLPYYGLLKALTYSVFVWELLGPLLLLSRNYRVRLMVCLGFFGLHMGFGVFLRVGIFMWTPCLFFLALLPPELWKNADVKLGKYRPLASALKAGHHEYNLRHTKWFLALLLASSFFWSLENTVYKIKILPESFRALGNYTGLKQRWSVFVHLNEFPDSWVQVPAVLEDGSFVDLFQGRDPLHWEKPLVVSEQHGHFRWPTPIVSIVATEFLHRPFVEALIRQWDAEHPERKVQNAQIVTFMEKTLPGYQDFPPVPRLVYVLKPESDMGLKLR